MDNALQQTPEPMAAVAVLPETPELAPAAPVIELDGLSVTFGGRPILRELRGELRGRAIGLLGPNGAGKTTLIHTLLGFHSPSSGTAHIFGRDIRNERKTDSHADRLHARTRFVHRQHDLRSFRSVDGRAFGFALGSGARTRARSACSMLGWVKLAIASLEPTRLG